MIENYFKIIAEISLLSNCKKCCKAIENEDNGENNSPALCLKLSFFINTLEIIRCLYSVGTVCFCIEVFVPPETEC